MDSLRLNLTNIYSHSYNYQYEVLIQMLGEQKEISQIHTISPYFIVFGSLLLYLINFAVMRYFLQLSFKEPVIMDGRNRAIPRTLCKKFATMHFLKILKHPVKLAGAGRTDTGVHAEHFFAHFDSSNETLTIEKEK